MADHLFCYNVAVGCALHLQRDRILASAPVKAAAHRFAAYGPDRRLRCGSCSATKWQGGGYASLQKLRREDHIIRCDLPQGEQLQDLLRKDHTGHLQRGMAAQAFSRSAVDVRHHKCHIIL